MLRWERVIHCWKTFPAFCTPPSLCKCIFKCCVLCRPTKVTCKANSIIPQASLDSENLICKAQAISPSWYIFFPFVLEVTHYLAALTMGMWLELGKWLGKNDKRVVLVFIFPMSQIVQPLFSPLKWMGSLPMSQNWARTRPDYPVTFRWDVFQGKWLFCLDSAWGQKAKIWPPLCYLHQ